MSVLQAFSKTIRISANPVELAVFPVGIKIIVSSVLNQQYLIMKAIVVVLKELPLILANQLLPAHLVSKLV